MDVKAVEKSINFAIQESKCEMFFLFGLGILFIVLGFAFLIYHLISGNQLGITTSAAIELFFFWPFGKLYQMLQARQSLRIVPSIIGSLPPEKAIPRINNLYKKLSKKI